MSDDNTVEGTVSHVEGDSNNVSDQKRDEVPCPDAENNCEASCSVLEEQVKDTEQLKNELLIECNRRAYLDGTFFSPDLNNLSFDGSVIGICQTCKKESGKHHPISGNLKASSNFVKHLKAVHKRELEEYKAYVITKNKKLKTDHDAHTYKSYCTFSQGHFEENVINYVLESMAPLDTVESPAFRKIFDDMKIKNHGKMLKHLSARSIGRRIEQTFQKSIADISTNLATVSYVCTTADTWSSRQRRFIGMTAHWIDEETLERKSCAIACRRLKGDHSYDKIAGAIKNIHESYGLLGSKVIATVTDNGSNFVKAFREFGLHFGNSFFQDEIMEINDTVDCESEADSDHASIEPFEECNNSSSALSQHFRCASHTLNLIATTDMLVGIKSSKNLKSAYDEMIGRCNNLWHFQRSPKNCEKLKSKLGQSLKRPVVTRWNSLYDALKQILSLKDKILQGSQELGIHNPLRDIDFRFIEEYIKCNKPVAEGLDLLQGETKCYYGYLLPTLVTIKNKLQSLENSDLQWCKALVTALLKGVNRRFQKLLNVEEEGRVCAIAAATHPLFKLKWLKCLGTTAQGNVYSALRDAFSSVTEENNQEIPMNTDNQDFFDFSCTSDSENDTIHAFGMDGEETTYQKFSSEKRSDLGLLNSYPAVKKVFLKFNTPLPSSAAVERLFSYATMFNLPKYNKLTDEKFELRVLMKCNSKAD